MDRVHRLALAFYRSPFAAAASLFVLTILVFWKIALTSQFTWLDNPDLVDQVLPWLREVVRQLRTGHFPVWDSHHWGGQSLIGQMQPGVAFPLNWLLAMAPLARDHFQLQYLNWYFVLIHYLGALFCYALCRDLGRSRPASTLASVSFALCGYVGTTTWPQMLNGAIWTPLVFLFLFRALKGGRIWFNIAVSGAFLGVALLGGHHQVPTFVGLSVLLVLALFVISRRISVSRGAILFSLFALFTFLFGSVQLLTSREYYQHAMRWVGTENPVTWNDTVPYFAHMTFSFNPAALFGIVIPGWYPQATPFIGLTIFALAVIAVVTSWNFEHVRVLCCLGLLGLLFSLGGWSIIHGVAYAVIPTVDKARTPAFAMCIFQFAAAVLSAFGLDALMGRTAMSEFPRKVAVAALSLGGLLFLLLLIRHSFQGNAAFDDSRVGLAGVSSLLLGIVLLNWVNKRSGRIATVACLLIVLMFEIGNVTGSDYKHREQKWSLLDRLYQNDDLAEFLRARLGGGRFEKDRSTVPYNLGDWHGLDEYSGYAGVTRNIIRIAFEPNTRKLLGVRYYIAAKGRTEGQTPVFQTRSGLNVYEDGDAFPRAWSVKSVEIVSSEEAVAGRVVAVPSTYLRNTAILGPASPAQLEKCEGDDDVSISQVRPTRFRLQVAMACRRLIVIGNTYFPGWKATVDGKPVRVYEVNGFLQGILVPAGSHYVELRYRPASLYIGLGLLGTGLLLLTALAWKDRSGRLP